MLKSNGNAVTQVSVVSTIRRCGGRPCKLEKVDSIATKIGTIDYVTEFSKILQVFSLGSTVTPPNICEIQRSRTVFTIHFFLVPQPDAEFKWYDVA